MTSQSPDRASRPNSVRRRVRFVNGGWRSLLVAAAVSRVFVRPKVVGREYLDREGAMIVTSTHLSEFDPIALFGLITRYRRDVTFLALVELFKNPIIRGLLKWHGIIPVMRGTDAAVEASNAGVNVLRHDGVVAAFFEGEISTTGKILPAKAGVAYMALATGSPVVPVAVAGTQNVTPSRWRPGQRYVIVVGEAIQVPQIDSPTAQDRADFTEAYVAEVAKLREQAERILLSL